MSQVPWNTGQAGDDVIAGLHIADVGADLLDDAGVIYAPEWWAAATDTNLP